MEYVLLGNACVSSQGRRVKLTAEIFVDCPLHPYVYGECFKISEAEEGGAGCHLIAHALYALSALNRVGIASCGGYHRKIDFTRADLFGSVQQILISEAGL